ncbi:MAG: LysM domain-containing protein [Betaproteobacteria bacterium]|nr:LysM domain-containing protein [Betaproteobacteria bacterium]
MSSDPARTLAQLAGKAPAFAPESRYHTVPTAQYTFADGRTVTYVRRRFAPEAGRLGVIAEHTVTQGDRLDRIAYTYYGNAELFWRVCDGNDAVRPDDLVEEIGTRLRIALPPGVPGG